MRTPALLVAVLLPWCLLASELEWVRWVMVDVSGNTPNSTGRAQERMEGAPDIVDWYQGIQAATVIQLHAATLSRILRILA